MNIVCPHCGRDHALFWYVLKHERKNICFRCDRVDQMQKDGRIIKVAKTEIYTGIVPEH